MSEFIFKGYRFDSSIGEAIFSYAFDNGRAFQERVAFDEHNEDLDAELLDKALFLSFVLVGTSYIKTFPTPFVRFASEMSIDAWQATFFNEVYQEGMSQYALENNLTRADLAHFDPTVQSSGLPSAYDGKGIIVLQSGGKDSLLTAALLSKEDQSFTPWFASSTLHHPKVLDDFDSPLVAVKRSLDWHGLKQAASEGGKNGHVPITYIVQSWAVIQAILLKKNEILVSIGHEGEEPQGWVGDLPVNHQWSKTWGAEKAFSDYIARYISPDIRIGSPLRAFSELRIAELFVQNAWQQYGHTFSSCNVINYRQGIDNAELRWCGNCPKCANSFLLFAPFLSGDELRIIFDGQDLFAKDSLQETFKGLLGIDDVKKPLECVGETDELRLAYHMAMTNGDYQALSFNVPASDFDYKRKYAAEIWAQTKVGLDKL